MSNKKGNAHLNIDRYSEKNGIKIISDNLIKDYSGMYDCTYFKELDLFKWLCASNITNGSVIIEINKKSLNEHSIIKKEKLDDYLIIFIENKEIIKIINKNNEIIFNGKNDLNGFNVGWFGMIFDYYTGFITQNILKFNKNLDIKSIWGII